MRKYRRMEVGLKLVLLLMAILLSVSATETRGSHAEAPVTEQILNQVVNSLRMFVDELPQMPKIYGYSKKKGKFLPAQLTVGMFQKKWKFHRDLPATTVFSYGTSRKSATVPGPTIETLQGIATYIRWENNLPKNHILPWDPTVPTAIPKYGGVPAVVHLHGGIHEPESDGSAFAWYTAGFKETGPAWTKPTYTYPNVQQPGNLWYHDHALGLTRATLLAGLVGAYTIRNPTVETPFNLPSGDEFDRHLMVFDRSFQKDGSLYMNFTGNNPSIHPQWQPEYFGDAIIVNGKAWPFLRVQRRKYRFRIINASNARYYNFRLSNGLPFIHVGSDSTYLSSPVTSTSILLAPSEITDIIIDFSLSEQNEIILINDARYPYPAGKPTGTLDGNIMKFIISFQTPNPLDSSTIPSKLVNYTIAREEEAIKRRYIAMYEYLSSSGSPTHLYINGKRLEDPVTEKPKSGSVEVWEVINLTGDDHPLHLHLANFQAIRSTQLVNISTFKTCMQTVGDPVKCHVKAHATGKVFDIRPYERTWKNGVKIPPGHMTTIVVKFKLVENDAPYPFDATAKPGYVYHCHILDHEDNAMIRPMHLVP